MIIYNIIRSSVTMAGTTPLFTIVPGAGRSCLLMELDFEGMGTASAANEIGIYRVAAAGTGAATAIANTPTAVEGSTGTLTFSGAVNLSYATTQPTFAATAIVHNMPLNSNGQRYFWRCNPNLNNAIVMPSIAIPGLVFAPISGTGSVSGRVQIAEM